jgi:hypothetical protein
MLVLLLGITPPGINNSVEYAAYRDNNAFETDFCFGTDFCLGFAWQNPRQAFASLRPQKPLKALLCGRNQNSNANIHF